MQYSPKGAEGEKTVEMATGDSSGGRHIILGLNSTSLYTVEVAAVNSAGTGVYSDSITVMTSGEQLNVI